MPFTKHCIEDSLRTPHYGLIKETKRGSPIGCRPSTAEAPLIGKIHTFNNIAVTLVPVMKFAALQDYIVILSIL